MRKNLTVKWIAGCFFAAFLLVGYLTGCKKEALVYQTSDKVNITSFMDKYPEQFSEFRKILEVTGYSGFLQAYGKYTIFLPTNDGVKAYLTKHKKASVEQMNVDSLKDFVKFHVLEDTVSTSKFGDGKLKNLTMYGQYLTTATTNVGGSAKIRINRQADIIQPNIKVGNGVIHVIGSALEPAALTLAKLIESTPGYTLFTQALIKTGLYDSLNYLPANNPDPNKKWLTVLAESDEVLNKAGVTTITELINKYSSTTNESELKKPSNGLHAFMAYHILEDAKYLADIASSQAHATLAKPEIITAKLENEQILINDIDFNGTYEPGFLLPRATGDVSASNGVFHATAGYTPPVGLATNGHYEIKVRTPFAVYWDVADFPEVRKQVAIFRKTGFADFFKTSSSAVPPIAGWDWFFRAANQSHRYNNATEQWVFNDYMNLAVGIGTRSEWLNMRTPLIVRGKYKIWMCYRRQNQSGAWPTGSRTQCAVRLDGILAPRPFDFAEPIPSGSSAELESLGWKRYTSAASGQYVSKLVGIVDIPTTDRHTLRLDVLVGSQSTNNLDMVHFIPVDQNQILPRFKTDGTYDYNPLP